MSWYSSVDQVSGYVLDDQGSFPTRARDISLHSHVHFGFGTSMGSRVHFSGDKIAGMSI
jgi:hypothetical protein